MPPTPSSSIQHVAAAAAADAAAPAAASAAAAASIASVAAAAAGAAVMPLLRLLLWLQLLLQLQFAAAADPADGSSAEVSDSTSSAWIVESYRPRGPWCGHLGKQAVCPWRPFWYRHFLLWRCFLPWRDH